MKMLRKQVLALALAIVGVALIGTGTPAQADSFTFTSCHITGGCTTPASFGTVTLTQSGSNVVFDVVLTSGNRFVETGAGGNSLFLFNDTVAGSTITGITATLNGVTVALPPGGLSGLTNQSPIMADGTGTFTAQVFCTVASDCNGGSTPTFNDLHFTVTNATIAGLLTPNANGNFFVADILCGQVGCPAGGPTGLVDVNVVPAPIVGAGLPGLLMACGGLVALGRRRRQKVA
jgi:hypothetical protein